MGNLLILLGLYVFKGKLLPQSRKGVSCTDTSFNTRIVPQDTQDAAEVEHPGFCTLGQIHCFASNMQANSTDSSYMADHCSRWFERLAVPQRLTSILRNDVAYNNQFRGKESGHWDSFLFVTGEL